MGNYLNTQNKLKKDKLSGDSIKGTVSTNPVKDKKVAYTNDAKTTNKTKNTNKITKLNGVDQSLMDKANGTFQTSQAYQDAMTQTNALLEKITSGRTSYTDQIKELMGQIQGRDKFSYDIDNDMLFQQYLGSMTQSGQTAMQDTIGQASALTGGYGSTYATSVGNQAYNQYIQEAYNNLPEYYNLALQSYQMEGEDMYNQLAMLNSADATEYGRLVDSFSANNSMASQLYNQEYQQFTDDRNNAMNLANMQNSDWWNKTNYDESVRQYEKSFEENQRQFNKSYEQSEKNYLANYDVNGDGKVDEKDKQTSNAFDPKNIPSEITQKAAKFGNNSELAEYLDIQVENGILTEEEADYLYSANVTVKKTPLQQLLDDIKWTFAK